MTKNQKTILGVGVLAVAGFLVYTNTKKSFSFGRPIRLRNRNAKRMANPVQTRGTKPIPTRGTKPPEGGYTKPPEGAYGTPVPRLYKILNTRF